MRITGFRKNRDENDSRAEFFWVESTSELGFFFSRSSLIFFEINVVNIIMAVDNNMATVAVVIIIIIIILGISFMQGIYPYIPETNHVPREHRVAAILM